MGDYTKASLKPPLACHILPGVCRLPPAADVEVAAVLKNTQGASRHVTNTLRATLGSVVVDIRKKSAVSYHNAKIFPYFPPQ